MIDYKPPTLDPLPDIEVDFTDGYIVITHRKDTRMLKFTRIKTISDDNPDNLYRTSYYRIEGLNTPKTSKE